MNAKFLVFDIYVETIIYLLLNNFHDCNFKYVCVCVCVRERKKLIALISLQSFLRHIRNVNLLFKQDFRSAELLTKTSFSLYFRDLPKMAKETKDTSKV